MTPAQGCFCRKRTTAPIRSGLRSRTCSRTVWPLLAIANHPVLILGVPALVLYLFAVWAAMVAVLLALARRLRAPEDES